MFTLKEMQSFLINLAFVLFIVGYLLILSYYLIDYGPINPSYNNNTNNTFHFTSIRDYQEPDRIDQALTLFTLDFKSNQQRIMQLPVHQIPKMVYVLPKSSSNSLNRFLYSYITGFTVAILTYSPLVLVGWNGLDQLIQEPLANSFQNQLNGQYWPTNRTVFRFPGLTDNSFQTTKNLTTQTSSIPDGYTHFMIRGETALFFELACNQAFYQTFLTHGLVSNTTIRDAIAAHNLTHYEPKINALYQVGFELAHKILSSFWTPSSYLQSLIDYHIDKYFTNYYVIGVQLELGLFQSSWNDTKQLVIECVETVRKANQVSLNDVKPFLLTSRVEFLDWLEETSFDFIRIDKSVYDSQMSRNHWLKETLGLELLARSNEMIISGGSIFGFAASIRSGRFAWSMDLSSKNRCQMFNFATNPSKYEFLNVAALK